MKWRKMKIQVQPRRNYGKVLYKPMCEMATLFASLHRRRNCNQMLTKREIDIIQKLGFIVQMIPYIEEVK